MKPECVIPRIFLSKIDEIWKVLCYDFEQNVAEIIEI
jgi:hypothetical protein